MNQFLRLFNMAVMKGISFLWIVSCFARILPYFCSMAVPMAFLVAMLLTLGQLSEDGELLALRASGFSFSEMMWPFLSLALLLSGLLFYVNHKAAPDGFHSFRNQYVRAAGQIARVDLEPGSFMQLGPWKLYARQTDNATGRLEGVYLVRAGESSAMRVSARAGKLGLGAGNVLLELEDGQLQMPNPDPGKLTVGRFARYRVQVPGAAVVDPNRHLDIPELNSRRLKERISSPQTSLQHRLEYTVELALRSAAALSPFIFFWVAAPLGLGMGKNSRGMSFGASLAILLVFYGLLAVGIGLGRRDARLSSAAPWLANVAVLVAGVVLTRRMVAR
jgi:lipopolysaccharide export system permease protein